MDTDRSSHVCLTASEESQCVNAVRASCACVWLINARVVRIAATVGEALAGRAKVHAPH